MNPVMLAWLLGVSAFCLVAALHLFLSRRLRTGDRVHLFFKLSSAFAPIVLGAASILGWYGTTHHLMQSAEDRWQLLNAGALYFFGYMGLLVFYAAIDHSVRGRIAVEFYRATPLKVPLPKLMEKYHPEAAASRRVEQLTLGGYITRQGDQILLTPKGENIVQVSMGIRRLYHGTGYVSQSYEGNSP